MVIVITRRSGDQLSENIYGLYEQKFIHVGVGRRPLTDLLLFFLQDLQNSFLISLRRGNAKAYPC